MFALHSTIHHTLRERISDEALMAEGRVYGGRLHKLEPKKLGNAIAHYILDIFPELFTD